MRFPGWRAARAAVSVVVLVWAGLPMPASATARPPSERLLVNMRFGYRFDLPQGWTPYPADAAPLEGSADLQLTRASSSGVSPLLEVLVCRSRGACPRPILPASEPAQRQITLAGTPAGELTYHRSHLGDEYDIVAHHNGYTYDLAAYLSVGEAGPPVVLEEIEASWHWQSLPMAVGAQLSQIQMIDVSSGWATEAGTGDILHTSNGGRSWLDVTPKGTRPDPTGCATDFRDALQAWWGCLQPPAWSGSEGAVELWRTKDGGLSWALTRVAVTLPASEMRGATVAIDFLTPAVGWLLVEPALESTASGETLRSADGGASWARVGPAPGGSSFARVAPAPGDGSAEVLGATMEFVTRLRGWAISAATGTRNELYHTTTGGASWHIVQLPKVPRSVSRHYIATAVSPDGTPVCERTAEARCYVTTTWEDIHGVTIGAGIVLSRDGGDRWSWVSGVPFPSPLRLGSWWVDQLAGSAGIWLWSVPTHDWESSGPTRGALYRCMDGSAWERRGVLTDVAAMDFVSSRTGWVLKYDPVTGLRSLAATADSGAHWTTFDPVVRRPAVSAN